MPGTKASQEERREQILSAAHRVAVRKTLRGLTIRGVAEEAEVSVGLVHFHFESKDDLVLAILERLLRRRHEKRLAAAARVSDLEPGRAVREFLRHEIERAVEEREPVELFFDFWVMGVSTPEIRDRVRASLERYRTMVTDLVASLTPGSARRSGPERATGLAAVAVSLIEGCALQAVIAPAGFDLSAYLEQADALITPFAPRSVPE